MFASGTVRDEMSSSIISYPKELRDRENICSIDYKISSSNLIKLQISTLRDGGYLMYLSSLDRDNKYLIKYGSLENWGKFSSRRLSSTRRIINDCNQECRLTYTRISVCSDATVDIKDEEIVDVFRAEVGENYNLSCIGTGSPYLTAEWRDKDGNVIPGHTEDERDFKIISKLAIPSFELNQTGDYTCSIFNKIFQTRTEKVISLHSLVILSSPNITKIPGSSETVDLDWTVQGWPLGAVQLKCETDNETLNSVLQYLEGFPPKLQLTVTVSTSSNFVVCVMMNGTQIIRQYIIPHYDSSEEGIAVRGDDGKTVLYPLVFLAFSLGFIAGFVFNKYGWPTVRSCLISRPSSQSGNTVVHYNSLPTNYLATESSDAVSVLPNPNTSDTAAPADTNSNINQPNPENRPDDQSVPSYHSEPIQADGDGSLAGQLRDYSGKKRAKRRKKVVKFKNIDSAPARMG